MTDSNLSDGFCLSCPTLEAYAGIAAEQYLNDFGCTGENERPTLKISNPPNGVKSFAVTFYDEDAPTGSGFWHWVVYNLPADTVLLPSGDLPEGALEANSDFGVPGYFGPCPPVGREHRYTFTVHALDVEQLDIPDVHTGALAGFFIYQHTIDKASFTVKAGPRSG
ncbi:YbhB/YbcL family Raf kinase inhibitor-like protein [Motiliproteus sp. MSK22-1]|uniref:YbhB/YbcL family Raf kinase inhibitor-like protein n=1 Tax=Motiliproteus sp. MSK22-1 TaxID=1897630 RepID=UPI001E6166A0|nr:YbhB/YbcL family Raf kinase inhibitor-like protein [Motiliproteus sp. MSK22-1]